MKQNDVEPALKTQIPSKRTKKNALCFETGSREAEQLDKRMWRLNNIIDITICGCDGGVRIYGT